MSQPVHSDADFDHPTHPFAYVVNIPLITMTPENGSTELWLGTHKDSGLHVQDGMHGERASGRIKPDALKKQRAIRSPSQPIVPKGSFVLRDLRLWHAGIGNQTDMVRVMLAMSECAYVPRYIAGNVMLTKKSTLPRGTATGCGWSCRTASGRLLRGRRIWTFRSPG